MKNFSLEETALESGDPVLVRTYTGGSVSDDLGVFEPTIHEHVPTCAHGVDDTASCHVEACRGIDPEGVLIGTARQCPEPLRIVRKKS